MGWRSCSMCKHMCYMHTLPSFMHQYGVAAVKLHSAAAARSPHQSCAALCCLLCTGNLFCFPKYYAKEVEVPTLTCPDGYSSNGTNSIGGIACTKQAYVQKQNCFRSMQCPADGQNTVADELW
jgi:hypothetical protein